MLHKRKLPKNLQQQQQQPRGERENKIESKLKTTKQVLCASTSARAIGGRGDWGKLGKVNARAAAGCSGCQLKFEHVELSFAPKCRQHFFLCLCRLLKNSMIFITQRTAHKAQQTKLFSQELQQYLI